VPNKIQIIQGPKMFGRFTIAARNLGRPVFVGKKCLNEKKMTCFLEKIVLVCRSQKNQIAY
jgi:hypothetical protein